MSRPFECHIGLRLQVVAFSHRN